MTKFLLKFFMFSFTVFWLFSCHEIVTYSEVPEIKYLRFNTNDSTIEFSFTDGDGNIGLNQGDSIIGDSVLDRNLFIKLFQKTDSVFEEVNLFIPLNYIIPYIEPQGQNKTLIGKMVFSFSSIKPFPYDTFKFSFYIVDNSFNKSNIVLTPSLTFN